MQIANQLVPAQFRAAATMFEAVEFQVERATDSGWHDALPLALEHARTGWDMLSGAPGAGRVEFQTIARQLVVDPLAAVVAKIEADPSYEPFFRDLTPIAHAAGSLARNLSPQG